MVEKGSQHDQWRTLLAALIPPGTGESVYGQQSGPSREMRNLPCLFCHNREPPLKVSTQHSMLGSSVIVKRPEDRLRHLPSLDVRIRAPIPGRVTREVFWDEERIPITHVRNLIEES